MKKIKLSILLMLLAFTLCFSCGGLAAVNLDVSLYIKKDTNTFFSVEELTRLRITANGTVAKEFLPDGTELGGCGKDEDGNYYRIISYYLGSGRIEWRINETVKSYKSKMKNFYFIIEDISGVYETFTMNPIDNSYTVINESIPTIKYTVTLKKK